MPQIYLTREYIRGGVTFNAGTVIEVSPSEKRKLEENDYGRCPTGGEILTRSVNSLHNRAISERDTFAR